MRRPLVLCLLLVGCGGRIIAEESDGAVEDSASVGVARDSAVGGTDASGGVDVAVGVDSSKVDTAKACIPEGSKIGPPGECVTESFLRARVEASCPAGLATFTARGACSGSWSYRTYVCCEPSGVKCTEPRDEGDPSSCKDAGTWRKYSESECASKGMVLQSTTFTVHGLCAGEAKYSEYTAACCAPTR